ncbi:hypothetical protein GcM1_210043 [Golovinomyces cichoracearum]|uniref:Uncharacterized protein n=1 Tax=Golovinomyces cichoracearum TaxID=62708 RepID=A0A420IVJ9_9PEZI|nr:hypothetical protein GcM1_210043 [Golovinomyces cichoracearum]
MNEKLDSDQKKVADKKRDWAAGINLLTDTDEDVKQYIKKKSGEFTDPEIFLRMGSELPRRLRDTLRARGVYLPKDKKSMAGNLVTLMELDEPPKWPTNDREYSRIHSMLEQNQNECRQVNFSRNMEPKPKIGSSPSKLLELPDSNDTNVTQNSIRSVQTQDRTYDAARIANFTPCGYSRQLKMLAKIYDDHGEYSGKGDTLDYKFDIFVGLCENADIPESALEVAFPIMLEEDAHEFFFSFYDRREGKCQEELCNDIKNNFEGVKYKRTLLSELNRLTIK